jgi:hypothetical protein
MNVCNVRVGGGNSGQIFSRSNPGIVEVPQIEIQNGIREIRESGLEYV